MITADQAQRSEAPATGDAGRLYIGMDIGGTKTAAVVIDAAGNLGAETLLPTAQGNDGVLRTAEQAMSALAEQTGCPVGDFAAAGIGIPGQVDSERGVVRYAYNLGVQSLELAARLRERRGFSSGGGLTTGSLGSSGSYPSSSRLIGVKSASSDGGGNLPAKLPNAASRLLRISSPL